MNAARSQPAAKPYVRRFQRILAAIDILAQHPEGLPLVRLAELLQADPDEVRQEILAYYTAEAEGGPLLDGFREVPLTFTNAGGEDEDPMQAEVVVLTDPQALVDLGVQRMPTSQVADLWRLGQALLRVEPENEDLSSAVEALADGWLGGANAPAEDGVEFLGTLRTAITQCRRVDIVYSRAWQPGVIERRIEPYRIVVTRRGPEIDAGPLDDQGRPRSYLVDHLRAVTATDEPFERPDDIEAICDGNRAATAVRVVVPQDSAWPFDRLADRVERIREDGDDVELLVTVAPPVGWRVSLGLIPSGGQGFVLSPTGLRPAPAELAAELLAHHRLDLP